MDGVIVDTEYHDFQIQKAFIAEFNPNHNFSDKDFLQLVGKSYEDLYRLLQKFLDDKLSIKEVEREFDRFSEKQYKNIDYQSLFRKDILFILDYAKEHKLSLAVASSSTRQHILEVLEACQIKDYFDVINSGEALQQSKPNPEIYLKTLNELNLAADECLTVEDSYYGITAAKNAGIKTIAYQETRMKIDQSNADVCAKNMLEVLDYVKQYSNE
ncbi:haloacid dehalogenase [Xylocopilactobacillus apis]|uniref:Haloacid dehalogenase n=2 Tax=Xylocopilactobacillus apis TaxID=2932183 RepID=A0AAU9CSU6_9LACO|nr:haloacid dehalogenase [Xylocopilactobacillus apis]